MAVGDYLRIFRRFWWVVLLTTAIGAGIGYGSAWLSAPKYESTAQLFVTTQSGTSVGDAYQNNLFSQERAVSYAGLATSQQVAARAIDQLKAPISADELRSKITAKPVEKTVLLDITVEDADPAKAQSYANAVADQLVQLVSELETSRRGGTPAAGAVLVDDASYPSGAAGISLLVRTALGAAGGLVVGLLLAILWGALDGKLRRRERVEDVAGSLLLGALVADPKRSELDAVDLEAGGIAAERLRELRTNLQFAESEHGRPHVIAVTSPSRGDGRTTTAIDLAATLAETGRSVVLIDGDLMQASVAQRLSLSDEQRTRAGARGLSTVLAGSDDISDVVIENAAGEPWALVPAGPVAPTRRQLWASDRAVTVLETLARSFDYLVIDTPALDTCADGALAASLSDGGIVLARIGHTKSAKLRRALDMLHNTHASVLGVVVTGEQVKRDELAKPRDRSAGQSAKPKTGPGDQPTTVIPAVGDETAAEPSNGAHRLTRTNPGGR